MDQILGLHDKNQCEETKEHDGHYFDAEVKVLCGGTTTCGAWAHPAHETTEHKLVWCRGVCLCNKRNFPHGPGSHQII